MKFTYTYFDFASVPMHNLFKAQINIGYSVFITEKNLISNCCLISLGRKLLIPPVEIPIRVCLDWPVLSNHFTEMQSYFTDSHDN